MLGKRIYNTDIFEPGDYGKHPGDGNWYACTPNGHLANLVKHKVVEHDNHSITVTPSILVSNNRGELWHGFLEEGVWRSC